MTAVRALERRLHVLVVEDNAGDVELMRDALGELEVTADFMRDGESALRHLNAVASLPDLVLLDLKIPRVDGLGVLAAIKEDDRLRGIPVVVLTSSQAPQDLASAYSLHVTACFAKPPRGLRHLLADIIRFVEQAVRPPETTRRDSGLRAVRTGRPPTDELRRDRYLASILDSASDAIVGVSPMGLITSWNAAAETLYGHRADQVLGRRLHLIVPAEREGELDALCRQVQTDGTSERMRTVRVRADGREVHIELTFSPIRDLTGVFIGISAIAREITEQAHAEERFRLAVEAAPSAMLMLDARGEIVMLNTEAERLFGYAREELVGKSVDVLVPARFRDAHPEHRGAFMAAPESRAMGAGRELFGLRKDGTEVPVEIGLNPIRMADGHYVLSSIVDITERRQAEQKFRMAVSASPSGIVMVDDGGKIVLVNAETERMFGYPTGELIGRSVDVLVPSRYRGQHAHHRHSFGRSPEARAMGTGRDLFGLRQDGTEFPVEIGLNPIESAEGRFVLSTIVDITARKQSEEVLSRQAAELARSNEELEQFAYVASHDLQEPLRMVSSYTDLLQERYANELDAVAHRYIGYAQDGATRMRELIDDLLAYSRVRTRGQELTPVSAQVALDRALKNLRAALRDSGAILEGDVEAMVVADPSQLSQLFQNLLSNSLKFVKKSPPRIVLSVRRDGDKHVFAVKDNGIGIAPEYADRVFQMFERLHTRDEYSGTGIGLALCRRIVDRHGGSIWVDSDGVDGTTVLFSLQAVDAPG